MKLLLDSCVWAGAASFLRGVGHDVEAVAEWGADPGDEEILRYAKGSGRILVTIDKDFGQLAVFHGHAHCGIIRLVNLPARGQAVVCQRIIELYEAELIDGAIITADAGRVRIRQAQ